MMMTVLNEEAEEAPRDHKKRHCGKNKPEWKVMR